MLISQPYLSETAEEQLQIISSDNGFYIYKDGKYYENIIAPASAKLDEYIETNIAMPSKKMSKDEVYELLFKNYTFTQEQINVFYNKILKQFQTLSDEEALLVNFIFPLWTVGVNYRKNEKIKYEDNLYEVLQDHTSVANLQPNQATGFYRKIKLTNNLVLEWEQKSYELGDRVKYGSHIFESLINNNNWSPEIFPNAWQLI